jgi:hypothetical protein
MRARGVVTVLAAAAVLAYGVAGHSVGAVSDHEGIAGSGAGLCLLLVVGVVLGAGPRPPAFPQLRLRMSDGTPAERVVRRHSTTGRSRASPISLQRLRN